MAVGLVALAIVVAVAACRRAAPSDDDWQERMAKERAQDVAEQVGRLVLNPISELSALDGLCRSWLDSTVCHYVFQTTAPLRLRHRSRYASIACRDVADAADRVGFAKDIASGRSDVTCSRREEPNGTSVTVFRDARTGDYAFQVSQLTVPRRR